MIRRLILACLVLCATHAACAANETVRIVSGGRTRDAIVHLPAGYDPQSVYPLMLVLHPANGTGAGVERISNFDAVADRFGFIAAYPDSIGPLWDTQGDSDIRFIDALIAKLGQTLPITPKRIYLTGYSDGGGFAQDLVCAEAGTFAGLGAIDINLNPGRIATCRPDQLITYVTFHGTADPIIPYNGGMTHGPDGPSHETNSTLDTLDFWARHDGCTGIAPPAPFLDRLDNGKAVVDLFYQAYGCNGGTGATLYTITGGGHTWPGGTQQDSKRLGPVSQDVDASALIWRILSPHRSLAAGECFSGKTAACPVPNGAGVKACGANGFWDDCVAALCRPGFALKDGACTRQATGRR